MKSLPATLLLILLLSIHIVFAQQPSKHHLPNIVFILADDLGYGDVGVYGQKTIQTPNIDRLAKEGMLFTQFYAGSTVCAPSRSALMTGLHTGHTRVRGNANISLQSTDVTVAQLLQKAGYTTGMIGKWGLGDNESNGAPRKKGFDDFYGYLNQTRAHNYYTDYLDTNDGVDSLKNIVQHPNPKALGSYAIVKKEYSADKFLEKTLQFIESNKNNPFFLYLPYTLPHANNEAKQFNASGMEVPSLGIYENKDWPYDQKAHAAMITYLDTQVGIIMQKLKALGLDDNTLVIFTSDNGPHNEGGANSEFFNSSGPLRGAKRDMYEGGIRVPMIARWPGKIASGSTTDYIGAFWDVLPSFCELANTPPAKNIDGISIVPTLLQKGTQKNHEYLYWEFYEQGGKQAIRFGKWKCIKLNVDSANKEEIMLFDLEKDLKEQHNIAASNKAVVDKALQLMKQAHVYSPDFHFVQEATN